jgi:very-short-patch-repair endonuclease
MNCKFCEKLCVNKRSLSHHERTCPLNPERNYKNGMEGKVAWNSGLTKKDSAGLESMARKNSKTMKDKMEQGLKTPFVKSWWSEERKKKASDQKKKFFEENPEKHPNRILSKNRTRMPYPEKVAFDWLNDNRIDFVHQAKIGSYFPDFLIGNLIIEIDGERWHPPGNEKDKTRDEHLISLGYSIVRVLASENIENRLKQIFGV